MKRLQVMRRAARPATSSSFGEAMPRTSPATQLALSSSMYTFGVNNETLAGDAEGSEAGSDTPLWGGHIKGQPSDSIRTVHHSYSNLTSPTSSLYSASQRRDRTLPSVGTQAARTNQGSLSYCERELQRAQSRVVGLNAKLDGLEQARSPTHRGNSSKPSPAASAHQTPSKPSSAPPTMPSPGSAQRPGWGQPAPVPALTVHPHVRSSATESQGTQSVASAEDTAKGSARDLGMYTPAHLRTNRPAPTIATTRAATLRRQATAARMPLSPGSLASLGAASGATPGPTPPRSSGPTPGPTPPRSSATTPRSSMATAGTTNAPPSGPKPSGHAAAQAHPSTTPTLKPTSPQKNHSSSLSTPSRIGTGSPSIAQTPARQKPPLHAPPSALPPEGSHRGDSTHTDSALRDSSTSAQVQRHAPSNAHARTPPAQSKNGQGPRTPADNRGKVMRAGSLPRAPQPPPPSDYAAVAAAAFAEIRRSNLDGQQPQQQLEEQPHVVQVSLPDSPSVDSPSALSPPAPSSPSASGVKKGRDGRQGDVRHSLWIQPHSQDARHGPSAGDLPHPLPISELLLPPALEEDRDVPQQLAHQQQQQQQQQQEEQQTGQATHSRRDLHQAQLPPTDVVPGDVPVLAAKATHRRSYAEALAERVLQRNRELMRRGGRLAHEEHPDEGSEGVDKGLEAEVSAAIAAAEAAEAEAALAAAAAATSVRRAHTTAGTADLGDGAAAAATAAVSAGDRDQAVPVEQKQQQQQLQRRRQQEVALAESAQGSQSSGSGGKGEERQDELRLGELQGATGSGVRHVPKATMADDDDDERDAEEEGVEDAALATTAAGAATGVAADEEEDGVMHPCPISDGGRERPAQQHRLGLRKGSTDGAQDVDEEGIVGVGAGDAGAFLTANDSPLAAGQQEGGEEQDEQQEQHAHGKQYVQQGQHDKDQPGLLQGGAALAHKAPSYDGGISLSSSDEGDEEHTDLEQAHALRSGSSLGIDSKEHDGGTHDDDSDGNEHDGRESDGRGSDRHENDGRGSDGGVNDGHDSDGDDENGSHATVSRDRDDSKGDRKGHPGSNSRGWAGMEGLTSSDDGEDSMFYGEHTRASASATAAASSLTAPASEFQSFGNPFADGGNSSHSSRTSDHSLASKGATRWGGPSASQGHDERGSGKEGGGGKAVSSFRSFGNPFAAAEGSHEVPATLSSSQIGRQPSGMRATNSAAFNTDYFFSSSSESGPE